MQETKLIEPGTSCFDQKPRNESKIYQETEFHSSEGYLFIFSWLLPGLLKLLHWMLYRLDLPLEVLTASC